MPDSRELTTQERTILELVLRHGMSTGQTEALAQLAVARHGGPSHDGDDVCFVIDLPQDVPLIAGEPSPVSLDVRPHGSVRMGTIDVYIGDGRLSSVDLSLVTEPDGPNVPWPPLEMIVTPSSHPAPSGDVEKKDKK